MPSRRIRTRLAPCGHPTKLCGAFFLYVAGKLLFGFAAIVVGSYLVRSARLAKAIGVLAILGGLAAMAANLGGIIAGMAMVFPAGATGTVATPLLAVALAMRGRSEAP